MTGTATNPIDAHKAKIIPVIPTPSVDKISLDVISINIESVVDSTKLVGSDS